MSAAQLTAADREVLEFERTTWRFPGRREAVIRQRFGISAARHAQRVLALLENPAAAAYDPELVARLRRLQVTRAAARTTGMTSPTTGTVTR